MLLLAITQSSPAVSGSDTVPEVGDTATAGIDMSCWGRMYS